MGGNQHSQWKHKKLGFYKERNKGSLGALAKNKQKVKSLYLRQHWLLRLYCSCAFLVLTDDDYVMREGWGKRRSWRRRGAIWNPLALIWWSSCRKGWEPLGRSRPRSHFLEWERENNNIGGVGLLSDDSAWVNHDRELTSWFSIKWFRMKVKCDGIFELIPYQMINCELTTIENLWVQTCGQSFALNIAMVTRRRGLSLPVAVMPL